MLLELDHVAYTYTTRSQSVAALKDATASFAAGGLYAIIGKSGSGKSTLLSLIAGLMLPTGGEVRYDNVATRAMDLNRYRRDMVTVIYQSFNLFPLLTALENVAYPLELKGLKAAPARAEAARHIASVGLAEDLHRRFPDQLSGGERQRVAIARALATGSRLILADEPTGNLDEATGAVVVDLLADLARRQQVTVILVTHDRDIARQADEIYRMRDGVLLRNDPAV
ncbi:MAG: ABC transporter ATP-binding protein [Eubacteriales bacterium]|nr:ABC transporter ATP-binding protein [Clostridiales bacterium]MDD2440585.1 ABC transporter ATP-binding protein [Eubacteriales bacterium]MDD4138828.1 ABC transporter ATP-binding protein [Eubacteriales bacterium]